MKEACEAYGELFLDGREFGQKLYARLLKESFPAEPESPLKEMGISYLGDTPITYSFKYKKSGGGQKVTGDKALRCVTEPGGRSVTVAGQIMVCLKLIDDILLENKWKAAEDVNKIVACIYPEDEKATENWLSGMWLGMDSSYPVPALKIYMNLRHQEEALRWLRLKNLFESFADAGFTETFDFMTTTLYKTGIPVGIGCAIGEEGLLGIRVYFAFPGILSYIPVMKEVCLRYYRDNWPAMERVITSVTDRFRDVESNLTLEFRLKKNGCLEPLPVRIKTELSLCKLPEKDQEAVKDYIGDLMEVEQFDSVGFKEDWAFMSLYWEKLFVQYLSIGAGLEGEHFSVYLEPVGEDSYGIT